ncbi:TetR/AcrR family transcriptional regulator [Nocardia macrotermitis]|uniref:Putative HTH-type transcriptional regulator n=1 Tax=Nocardia macrotermitis TaxID=2585198 RepID=A0A7K0D5X6_9NOCA|nr:TetR/AcrR family transcriptional regulator [Nocardia macrotermitis]MQY20961.1 putative HTH-type transcriptional regulator [Nocardia macrotermitis]
MSDVSPAAPARRVLTGKRAETVQRLADAAVETLRAVGYDELTLPSVAMQAGVARATAYTYYSSREHLVAEVYWRRLTSGSPADADSPQVAVRVVGVLRYLALVVADEPALGHAIAVALNSPDPDVKLLREETSRYIHKLIAAAVGSDGDAKTVLLLELLFTGAIVRAGSGEVAYTDIADLLEELVLDQLS